MLIPAIWDADVIFSHDKDNPSVDLARLSSSNELCASEFFQESD